MTELENKKVLVEIEQLQYKIIFELVKTYPIPASGYPSLAKAELRTFDYFNSYFLYNINRGNNLNG